MRLSSVYVCGSTFKFLYVMVVVTWADDKVDSIAKKAKSWITFIPVLLL